MAIKKFDDPMEAMHAIAEMQHKSIDIPVNESITITMKSLGAKDETETFVNCMHLWGQAFIHQHKIETLSKSIVLINGQPFKPSIETGPDLDYLTPENKLLKLKKDAIGKWRQGLVDMLYMKYANMVEDVDKFMEKIKITAETNAAGARENEKTSKEQKDA